MNFEISLIEMCFFLLKIRLETQSWVIGFVPRRAWFLSHFKKTKFLLDFIIMSNTPINYCQVSQIGWEEPVYKFQ